MEKSILELAAQAMKVTAEDAEQHCEYLEDINAYYFWNPVRGGIAVIVNEAGERLAATSGVSLDRHKQAFLSGRRN